MPTETLDRNVHMSKELAGVREDTLPPTIKVPEATVAAVSELLQKRDGLISEVKRLEAICDGLIEDFARHESLPLDQYRYAAATGYLEKLPQENGVQ